MGYALIDWKGKVLCTSKTLITKVPRGQRISYKSDNPIETYRDHGPILHCSSGDPKGKATRFGIVNTKKGLLYVYRIEVVGNVPKNVEKIIEILEHRLGAQDI